MDWGKRVQFVLGTARDKGHVLISSPAMRKCDWTEWVGRETMAGLVNAWPQCERKSGVLILIITRKGRIEKEGDETPGCSTVGAFAGSIEQAIRDLFYATLWRHPWSLPNPTSNIRLSPQIWNVVLRARDGTAMRDKEKVWWRWGRKPETIKPASSSVLWLPKAQCSTERGVCAIMETRIFEAASIFSAFSCWYCLIGYIPSAYPQLSNSAQHPRNCIHIRRFLVPGRQLDWQYRAITWSCKSI